MKTEDAMGAIAVVYATAVFTSIACARYGVWGLTLLAVVSGAWFIACLIDRRR